MHLRIQTVAAAVDGVACDSPRGFNMVHASQRSWRSGATRSLSAAGLILAGLFGLTQLAATAQDKEPLKGVTGKASKTGPVTKNTRPTTLKMTITSAGSDVPEMSKLINEKIEASWTANKITPSGYCDDYEFIRRASLDIIGRSARPDEIRTYMKDPADKRRSMVIERLLKHEDYARHWANLWSNWLLTRTGDFGKGKYHDQMTVWLEDQFAQNKPYNDIVTKLLTAAGKNTENGAVNFLLAHVGEPIPAGKQREEGQFEMVPLTSRITRVFLGTQVQCAQCHAHPFFASLTQESFWGINAFLRQIKRDGNLMIAGARMGPLPDLTLRDDESANPDATVFYEMRNGKVRMLAASFLASGGKERGPRLDPAKKGVARREELAKHVTEHEMFPKAMVNRMWGLLLGRGFVNPIDDFNDNNQPSNPELLNEVSARFKHYGYDFKKLIRWITHSNAYHLSYVANKTNDKPELESQFSRMVMKSVTPEQLFESLMAATHGDKNMSAAEKKKLRTEWLNRLINNFGDDEGNEVNFNGTIVQALLMMNGKNINDAITLPKGTIGMMMENKKTPAVIINELYLAALNRPPRPAELKRIQGMMALRGVKDTAKSQYEDLFWALLNSNEFLLNH